MYDIVSEKISTKYGILIGAEIGTKIKKNKKGKEIYKKVISKRKIEKLINSGIIVGSNHNKKLIEIIKGQKEESEEKMILNKTFRECLELFTLGKKLIKGNDNINYISKNNNLYSEEFYYLREIIRQIIVTDLKKFETMKNKILYTLDFVEMLFGYEDFFENREYRKRKNEKNNKEAK